MSLNHRRMAILFAVCLAAAPAAAGSAGARGLDPVEWTGGVDSDWFEDGNWNGGTPTATDTAVIDTDDPNPAVIDTGDAHLQSLTVGASNTGRLTLQNGGELSIGSNAWIGLEQGSEGEVIVTGETSLWNIDNSLFVGAAGTGALTIADGGAVNTGVIASVGSLPDSIGSLEIDNGGLLTSLVGVIGSEAGSTGAAVVDGTGSSWTNTDTLFVGRVGAGTLEIVNGGMLSSAIGFIGNIEGSDGAVTVSGADSTWINHGSFVIGNSGTGKLIVEQGGTFNSGGSGFVGAGASGAGTVAVTGTGARWTSGGDLSVSRGTLTAAAGGTLNANGALTLAGPAGSAAVLNIGSGGAAGILDTVSVNGGDGDARLYFDHTDADYAFTDDGTDHGQPVTITGSTAVAHIGTGTTVLTGDHNYTGGTRVDAGTLRIDGSIIGGVLVNAGGTLGGTGIVGDIAVADGGTLAPGASAGTLTAGSLTLGAGALLNFELGAPGTIGGGVNDLIVVEGDLVLDGVIHVTDLGGFSPGIYTLITYGGDLLDHGLSIGDLPAGLSAGIDVETAGEVRLVVSIEFTLTVDSIGQGTVQVKPDLPGYQPGDKLALTPLPAPGWVFAGWSGDAGGNEVPLAIIIEADTGITATFVFPEPALAFEPASLDFGNVETDTASADLTAILHNTGDGDATGLDFLVPANFDADTGDCGDALPAGGSCEVNMNFTPAAAGPSKGTLIVGTGEGAAAELELAGNGVELVDAIFSDRFEP